MHEDPISSIDHLPSDLGITGFIRTPQVPSPQVKKIEDETESYQKGDLNPFLRIDLRNSLPIVYHLFKTDPY
jgi:hypothetical protein